MQTISRCLKGPEDNFNTLFGAIFRTAAKKKHSVQIQRNRDGKVSFKDYNVPCKSESMEGLSMVITANAENFQKQM